VYLRKTFDPHPMTSRYPLLRHLHSGRLLGLALVAMPGLAAPALAEERDPFAPLPPLPLLREGVAGTRQIPGYIAPGVRAGAVLLSPQITARTDADSNVLTTRTGKQGDVAVAIAPAMVAGVDLADLHMSFSAQAEALRYARLTEQNRETFALQAQAARPLGGALQLGASLGWSLKDEPNYTASAADGDGPTRYHQLAGTLGLAAAFGPNRIAATLDFDRYDYLAVFRSGQMISQSFRDQRVLTAGLRAEHGLPGGKTLFVQADYSRADSRRPTPAFDRSCRHPWRPHPAGQRRTGRRLRLAKLPFTRLPQLGRAGLSRQGGMVRHPVDQPSGRFPPRHGRCRPARLGRRGGGQRAGPRIL